ncbi:hypothetical protein J6590_041766 [Homalodisca vitripennis]|nr:hypothetical protein J6590_041766 [Homalodisca vitripennis]
MIIQFTFLLVRLEEIQKKTVTKNLKWTLYIVSTSESLHLVQHCSRPKAGQSVAVGPNVKPPVRECRSAIMLNSLRRPTVRYTTC